MEIVQKNMSREMNYSIWVDFSGGFSSSEPLQLLNGVSHFKFPLGRCRGAGGVTAVAYTVACRTPLGHLA